MNVFENFGLSHELLQAIDGLGFTEPTQIQEMSIPSIMAGKDVLGESATGSGKTLAFGCGVIDNIVPRQGLQALILSPTRELAEQIKDMLNLLSYHKRLKIISIYGGVAIDPQISALSSADVVVATPGRFLDHLYRETVDTSRIKVLVLDEADRMLDMGFIDDVEKIIRTCPQQRQTLFFSATLDGRIKSLADRYMIDPLEVTATVYVDPSKLTQVYYNVSKNMKLSLLVHLLHHSGSEGLDMVFCNTRNNADFVEKNLRGNGIDAIAIHGGMSQNKRIKTIKDFNDRRVKVLVCTDVAARGLHIDNVQHIYNYDIPKDSKDYVHRIGRTARAGESGKVINILCDFDHDNFDRIIRDYHNFVIDREDTPQVERILAIKSGCGGSFGRGGYSDDNRSNGRGRSFGRGQFSGRSEQSGRGSSFGRGQSSGRGSSSGSDRSFGRGSSSDRRESSGRGRSFGGGRNSDRGNSSFGRGSPNGRRMPAFGLAVHDE